MKKSLAVMLAVAMMAGLTGCGGSGNAATAAPATTAAETATAVQKEETKQAEETSVGEQGVPSGEMAAANDPKVVLNYAEQNSETSLMGMTAQKFKEDVERLSGGSVEIQIYAGGVFGTAADIFGKQLRRNWGMRS